MIITKPGFYDGIDAEDYHGNICDAPSLSSSGARTIVGVCPQRFWFDSYLNPAFIPKFSKNFDIGHAGHYMMLEEDKFSEKVVLIDAPDWRTKAAKAARQEAYDTHRVPLLTKDLGPIQAMRKTLFSHSLAGEVFKRSGIAERSMFCRDPETGIWMKSRPDLLPQHRPFIVDYKTAANANPDDLEDIICDMGYHQQAAWYCDVYEHVMGHPAERFWFCAQEKKAPYLVSIFALTEDALQVGRDRNREAIDLFDYCLRKGEWPGYRPPGLPGKDSAFMIGLPYWAYIKHQDRIDRTARAKAKMLKMPITAEQVRLSYEAQRPLGD